MQRAKHCAQSSHLCQSNKNVNETRRYEGPGAWRNRRLSVSFFFAHSSPRALATLVIDMAQTLTRRTKLLLEVRRNERSRRRVETLRRLRDEALPDLLREHLAELHAPLVKRIDAPDPALDRDPMFI